jgi:hypothetical protein
MRTVPTARFDAMTEEAIIDCYNESEQAVGLFIMLEEHLSLPFETSLLGVPVIVKEIELNDRNDIVAVCTGNGVHQRISILDLTLPSPPPVGADWIAAYRHWAVHQ